MLPDGTFLPLSRFLLPVTLLLVAALSLSLSLFLPYWSMTMQAPQYPDGLQVAVHLTDVKGDVMEIDELNHYLGLPPIAEGGRLERAVAPWAVAGMALMLGVAAWTRGRVAALLTVPALAFPVGFAVDLGRILNEFGHSVDPQSAFGGAIEPFSPPLWGHGAIGQFATDSQFGSGFWLAALAMALAAAGLWAHRRAYKPLKDAQRPVEVNLGVESAEGLAAEMEALRP